MVWLVAEESGDYFIMISETKPIRGYYTEHLGTWIGSGVHKFKIDKEWYLSRYNLPLTYESEPVNLLEYKFTNDVLVNWMKIE